MAGPFPEGLFLRLLVALASLDAMASAIALRLLCHSYEGDVCAFFMLDSLAQAGVEPNTNALASSRGMGATIGVCVTMPADFPCEQIETACEIIVFENAGVKPGFSFPFLGFLCLFRYKEFPPDLRAPGPGRVF